MTIEDHEEERTWPPAGDLDPLTALWRTWTGAVFEPTSFFRTIPRSPSLGPPIVYYLIVGVLVAGIDLFWSSVFALLPGIGGAWQMAGDMPETGLANVVGFLLSPIFLLVGLFIGAGITHLILRIVGEIHGDFRTTTAVFCFAYSPMLFGVIPWLGDLVGGVWLVVIAILGLREAHRTDGWRAALAVLLPLGLAFALIMMIAVIAALIGITMEGLPAGF